MKRIQITDEERKMATRPNVYINKKKYTRKKIATKFKSNRGKIRLPGISFVSLRVRGNAILI